MPKSCPQCNAPLLEPLQDGLCFRCIARLTLTGAPDDPASAPPTAVEPRPGERVGDYEFLEIIGRGGMGVVYKARQSRLNRIVAIKTLPAAGSLHPEMLGRFRVEAEALACLRHPNIVGIHELIEEGERPLLVMEYVHGPTLAHQIRQGPMSPEAAALCVRKLALAVEYAHQRGILHRDLKPSNVILDEHGEPRLTDFGLAKRFESEAGFTLSHQMLGSPHYMAPEQIAARFGELGPHSDVYALGAMLYHLLAGQPPFLGATIEETLMQVMHENVTPFNQPGVRRTEGGKPDSSIPIPATPHASSISTASVPRDLETICRKCLEKESKRRYESAQQLGDDLGRFLRGEPTHARPLSPTARLIRWSRRKPALATLAAISITALTALAISLVWAEHRVGQRERIVRRNAYVADMRLAQQALEMNNRGRTLALLARYELHEKSAGLNASTGDDPRGWEWHWLKHECRSDETATLGAHQASVQIIVCSPDGNRVATASSDGEIRLWNLLTRAQTFSTRQSNTVTCLAFSPDGKTLVSTGPEGEVYYWDGHRLQPIRESITLSIQGIGAARRVTAARFTPDSEDLHLVTRNQDVRIKNWAAANPRVEAVIRGPHAWLYSAFSSDGRQVFSGQNDGTLHRWNFGNQKVSTWPGHAAFVSDIAASPDGTQFASASSDHTVKIWDAKTLREIATLRGHGGSVNAVAFSPDGHRLATGSRDQTIRLWSRPHHETIAVMRGHLGMVESLTFTPDSQQIISGSKDGSLKIWPNQPREDEVHSVSLPQDAFAVQLSHDGTMLFRALKKSKPTDPYVSDLWNTRTFERSAMFTGTEDNPMGLQDVAPQAALLATSPVLAKPVPFFDILVLNLQHVRLAALPATNFYRVRFSPDGRRLVVGHDSHEVGVWDWAATNQLARFPKARSFTLDMKFSPNGKYLAVSSEDGSMEVFDLDQKQKVGELRARLDAPRVAFSPDSRMVAMASYDGTARLWSAVERREVMVLRGSSDGLASIAFSGDGRRLATGTLEGSVKIWDLTTQQEILELRGHKDPAVIDVAFLPDDTLISVSVDSIRRWRASSRPTPHAR